MSPGVSRILSMHSLDVMMVMMMHVIMMTAARVVGRRRVLTVLGLLHPPFLLLRTSDHLLLLLLLQLRRLLRDGVSLFPVIAVRTASWRWLAARPVSMARCRADLDVLRIRRLRGMLHFDIGRRCSEEVQVEVFLFSTALLFAPHAMFGWRLRVTSGR